MQKLKTVALLPTIFSAGLTIAFAVLSLNFSGPSVQWVDSLRDSLFFFMQSETLLLAASSLIHLTGVSPESKLRALTASKDSLDCLSTVEAVHDRIGKTHPLFTNLLEMNIQAFAERMAPLRDGCYSCTAQEITRLTKDLYADSKESIEAVSLIDLREYWAHPALGSAAIDLNRDASLQKIQIQRIFVVQRKEELIAYADLLKAVQDNGVRLRYITLADAPESCRVDFAIYDRNKYVQYFEFEESTYNKRYSRCSISIQEPVVSKYRGIFDRLVRLSIPFDAAKFEIPTGESHSLWSSGAFRDHYQGAAPELHLATIQQRYSTVLDVGCGAGRILGLFADMGCQVTGIESDPTALAMCRRRVAGNPRVRLLNEQFGRTSLPGEKFDLVIAYNSIYHARRDEMFETLKRIAELVVPGGHV